MPSGQHAGRHGKEVVHGVRRLAEGKEEAPELEVASWGGHRHHGSRGSRSLDLAAGKGPAEEKMVQILTGKVKGRSKDLEFEPGSVALARIPLVPPGHEGFEIDGAQVIGGVKAAFMTITPLDIQVLYADL
jgi:hypothetical protein